jgi:DNA-binding response OmpR family regulator
MTDPSAAARPANLLLLERDPGLRRSVKLTLELDGLDVWDVEDETGAREVLSTRSPDVLVLDHENLAEHLGDLIERYRKDCAEKGIVLVTTARRIDDSWRTRYEPDLVVYKPFDVRFLCRRIKSLIEPVRH